MKSAKKEFVCYDCFKLKTCKESVASWVLFFIALIAVISLRAVNLLLGVNPFFAKALWYVGVIGFFIFFVYKFRYDQVLHRELDKAGLKDKLLYTVGGSTLELALIRSGILTGTSLLRPYDIGSIGANYMLDYLSGNQNIPKCVNIPTFFIDSTNVELYETDF